MVTATLQIKKQKKGNLLWEVVFKNGMQMEISPKFIFNSDMNNKHCEVEMHNSEIVRVTTINKYEKQKTKKQKRPANIPNIFTATAPYNFVSLNEKIITQKEPDSFDKYHDNTNTGYIDLEIEAKTPVYIRGVQKKDGTENSDFYKQAGKYRIPGSSLRGMVRTMVEMVSWGRLGYSMANDDKGKEIRYFYRTLKDKSKTLENDYRQFSVGGNRNIGFYNKAKAGYMYKKGLDNYKIKPASIIGKNQIFRVEDELVTNAKLNKNISIQYKNKKGNLKCKLNPNYKEKVEHVYFTYEEEKVHKHSVPMRYANITSIREYNGNKIKDEEIEGYLICSGYIPNRNKGKHLHWVISHEDTNSEIVKIPKNLIDSYKDDLDRIKSAKGKKGLITDISTIKGATPCFYVTDERGDVAGFGFTGHFRIPYENRVTDFMPKDTQSGVDIAESIFGNKDDFMTRLFFEDAFLLNNSLDKVTEKEKIPKILSNPKPTSFQLYLKQNENAIQPIYNKDNKLSGWEGIKSYNDKTEIRGNKLYWHRERTDWEEVIITLNKEKFKLLLKKENKNVKDFVPFIDKDQEGKIALKLKDMPEDLHNIIVTLIHNGLNAKESEKLESQHTLIKPIGAGAKFQGKIRFENLSDIELGALLFAVDLPQDLAHKIGMAKPLGLGSIRIDSKLYLSDRVNRYKNLFAEWGNIADESLRIEQFKQEFEKYIKNEIGKQKNSLWEIDRLKELKKMLDFEHKPAADNIKYMDLKEFKEREILPHPVNVK